jgi:cytidyltransferase-like protein
MKILIMGLPGSGKTTLADSLKLIIDSERFNADKIRKKYNDWDFSREGILRQSRRMKKLVGKSKKKITIADFICPLREGRKIFNSDFTVWVDTIKKGRFNNMNKIFEKPKKFDLHITDKNAKINSIIILDKIKGYKWLDKNPTSQMLGRFQPFHKGHLKLFEKALLLNGQVAIYVKSVTNIGDNPFTFSQVKKSIDTLLYKKFKYRYKVVKAPNINNICYGRKVGYEISYINLPRNIQKISATKIRKLLRSQGKLKKLKIN